MSQPVSITISAVYKKGTLQLDHPLELPDGTKLQLTITRLKDNAVLDAMDRKIIGEILAEDDEVFQALVK